MCFNMNCSKPDHFAGKVDLIWVRISNIRKKCNHMSSFTPMYSILRPPSFSNALWKTQFNIYSVNWYTKTVLSNLEKIILASNFKNDIVLFLFHSNKCFFWPEDKSRPEDKSEAFEMSSDCINRGHKAFCVYYGCNLVCYLQSDGACNGQKCQKDGLKCVSCHRASFELFWWQTVHLWRFCLWRCSTLLRNIVVEEEPVGGLESQNHFSQRWNGSHQPRVRERPRDIKNVERMVLNSSEQVTPNSTEPVTSST